MRFVVFLLIAVASAQRLTPTCRSHPAYQADWNPPLVRAWKNTGRPGLFEKILYAPRHWSKYYPISDPNSTRYHQTDLLYIGGSNAKDRVARLYLNRPAKVYLFIGVKRPGRRANLPGWKSEGYVRINDKRNIGVRYGVFQTGTLLLPVNAYVFSKQASAYIDIPSETYVWRSIGLPNNIRTHIRIAEYNGDPSRPVGLFRGIKIKPNTRCPGALHRTWVAKHRDTSDPALRDRVFGTWHPVWDPCFWCSYGHDHGSNPKPVMGYEPTFEYAALKNNFESEAHQGFKGFLFKMGKHTIYFSIHAQTSKLRRVTEQYHTTVLVIVNGKGKLMAEFTQKADFGFLAARGGIGVGFIPLRARDRKIQARQNLNFGEKRLRSVNVIDKNNLDRRFRYQLQRANLLRGVYEAWITGVMCGLPKRGGEMTIDFKNAITGIKSTREIDKMIKLRKISRNVGLMRSMKMDITMGIEHCKFKNGRVKGGYFYTDPRGNKLVKGPAPMAIRQYIDPSLRLRMHGFFEVPELGEGMFVDKEKGFFYDHGFGIDVKRN